MDQSSSPCPPTERGAVHAGGEAGVIGDTTCRRSPCTSGGACRGHVLAVQSGNRVGVRRARQAVLVPAAGADWQTASAFEVHDGLSHCVAASHVVQFCTPRRRRRARRLLPLRVVVARRAIAHCRSPFAACKQGEVWYWPLPQIVRAAHCWSVVALHAPVSYWVALHAVHGCGCVVVVPRRRPPGSHVRPVAARRDAAGVLGGGARAPNLSGVAHRGARRRRRGGRAAGRPPGTRRRDAAVVTHACRRAEQARRRWPARR